MAIIDILLIRQIKLIVLLPDNGTGLLQYFRAKS